MPLKSGFSDGLGGVNSLELYIIHYFFLGTLKVSDADVNTVLGFAEYVFNLGIVLLSTVLIIQVIKSNKMADIFLFGKKKLRN